MKHKFRAWDRTTNQMRDCYGFNDMEQEVYVCSVADDEFNGRPKTVHALKRGSDEVVIMQSTGLKDCEGKEIYEGDILIETKSKDTFEVKYGWFEDVSMSIFLQMGVYLYDGYETRPFYRLNYKVIGNVHENIELLEVAE